MKKNIDKIRNEKRNRSIYYAYIVGFIILLFALVGVSMSENNQKANNSKKIRKEEKKQ